MHDFISSDELDVSYTDTTAITAQCYGVSV